MNRAEEDYIKTIYELTFEKKQSLIKTSELAIHFGFTDQSVNDMIKKLESKKYVSFIPYKGISLTKKGVEIAITLVRKHRIWEVFLTKKLNFLWSDVHADAEMLEHAASDKVIDELYKYLGEPKYCQHGNPIPDKNGNMASVSTTSLDTLKEGERFTLTRVVDHKDLLLILDELHIKLFQSFEVVSKDEFAGLIKIKGDDIKTLSFSLAKMLFISK